MAEQILVPFEGEGGGVGPLSWGQQSMWGKFQQQKTWMPLGAVGPLPAGTTVDDVAAELRFWMCRHASLRTRLRFDPDGPQQVVADSGKVPLEIVDVDDAGDPEKVANEVLRRYRLTDYDFVTEWPVRMAVVRHRGVPTHRAVVVCHLATDGSGARELAEDLARRDPETGAAATPVSPMQPLAQARWQRTAAGQRQSQTVLRYWAGLLRTIPHRRFAAPIPAIRPRYWQGSSRSPALHLAVRALAARTGMSTSVVWTTVYVVAVGRVTGINPVATRVVVNNRFRPGMANVVAQIGQDGLLVVDLAGITVDEALARTRTRATSAYKYAYHDPVQLDSLFARIGAERGVALDVECCLNDRRLAGQDALTCGPGGTGPTEEQVRDALPLRTFYWEFRQDDDPYEKMLLNVEDPEDAGAIMVNGDATYVSPNDMEACVREMETVAVSAAFNPAEPTRVPAADQLVPRARRL